VLRLAAKSCCQEGHGRLKNLILNATPFPPESNPKVRSYLGINGNPVFDVATTLYSPPDLTEWWTPQLEAIIEDPNWTFATNYILVARSQNELVQLAQSLDGNETFHRIATSQMRTGSIYKFII
jgi:hypothetical protein